MRKCCEKMISGCNSVATKKNKKSPILQNYVTLRLPFGSFSIHSNPIHTSIYSLIYINRGVEWFGSFLKYFQKGGEG